MKTTKVPLVSKSDLQSPANKAKAVDYLHRQFPWKTREVIANAFQEAGANFTRAFKVLNTASANQLNTQPVLAN